MIDQRFVRVLHVDAEGCQQIDREVDQVLRHDHVAALGAGDGRHVPIIRIGQPPSSLRWLR